MLLTQNKQNILPPESMQIKCGIIDRRVWPLLESSFQFWSTLLLLHATSEVIALQRCFELHRGDPGLNTIASLTKLRNEDLNTLFIQQNRMLAISILMSFDKLSPMKRKL